MLRGNHEYRVDVARADGTGIIVMSGSDHPSVHATRDPAAAAAGSHVG
jgi:hypothetical protein